MDLIYNADVGAGLVKAVLVDSPTERTIHLGSGEAVTLRDVAAIITEETGTQANINLGGGRDPMGAEGARVNYLIFDISRAERVLNWRPVFDMRRALGHYLEMMERLGIPPLAGSAR